MTPEISDVLIIGGSHAGLAAALTLYRALHTCVIIDSHTPRNKFATPVRLTPTWDGEEPEKLIAASRKELQAAGGTIFVDATVEKIGSTSDGLFEAVDSNGKKWTGRKVLLATGSKDILPNITGYESLYTRRIFPCMYQFGYEFRGCASAGLLAVDGLSNVMQSTMLADDGNKFADIMNIYTDNNSNLASEISAAIQTSSVAVDDRKIKALTEGENSSGVTIEFEDGSKKTEAFLVHRPKTQLDRTLADQLGLKISPMGEIEVTPPFCRTSVPGVYAAGDCGSMMKIIPNAISMGAYAGCGISRELPKRVTGRGAQ